MPIPRQAFKVLCRGDPKISRAKVVKFFQDALKSVSDKEFDEVDPLIRRSTPSARPLRMVCLQAVANMVNGVVSTLRTELQATQMKLAVAKDHIVTAGLRQVTCTPAPPTHPSGLHHAKGNANRAQRVASVRRWQEPCDA